MKFKSLLTFCCYAVCLSTAMLLSAGCEGASNTSGSGESSAEHDSDHDHEHGEHGEHAEGSHDNDGDKGVDNDADGSHDRKAIVGCARSDRPYWRRALQVPIKTPNPTATTMVIRRTTKKAQIKTKIVKVITKMAMAMAMATVTTTTRSS